MGHARALLALSDPRMQAEVASLVAKKALSVRETEALVRRVQAGGDKGGAGGKGSSTARPVDPDVQRLEHDLSDRLGARVEVQHGARGRGKLVINYTSLDELEGIIAHIQ